MSRTTGCLLASCAWLAIASAARPSLAQPPKAPEPPQGEVEVEKMVGVQQLDTSVETVILGGTLAFEVRSKLQSALTQDIDRYDRRYGLTPAQKKKLELAGRLDIKRFFDRVEDAKAAYGRANGDWNQVGASIFELQRMQNQPHSEIFGDESMFAKTLKKNLTPQQVARHEKNVYRGRVEWMAGLLDKRLNLNADQHRRLVELVVDETPPLRRYGDFDYDAIMFQMSRLSTDRLRTVLAESQCRELGMRFVQARRMQTILVSEGYISRAGTTRDQTDATAGRDREKTALAPTEAIRVGPN